MQQLPLFATPLPLGSPVLYRGDFGKALPVAAIVVGLDCEADGRLVYILDVNGQRRWGYENQIEPAE